MKEVLKYVGAATIAAVTLAVPALTVCSFVYGWYPGIQGFLVVMSLTDFLVVGAIVMEAQE